MAENDSLPPWFSPEVIAQRIVPGDGIIAFLTVPLTLLREQDKK